MDHIPVELVTAIALLACTDGGRTGCSLSLVSKRIRDASHPARFHSVSLPLGSRPERLASFLRTFEAQHARLPDSLARVRHLYISLLTFDPEPLKRRPPPPRCDLMRAYEEFLTKLHDLGATYGQTLCALMRGVAPDLETLAFVRAEWKNVPALHCAFPRLRELTLVDGYPEFLRLGHGTAALELEPPSTDRWTLFPALERLHVAEFLGARAFDLCEWAPHAPVLGQIRCSGLHYFDSATVSSLRAISAPVASESEEEERGGEGARLFPHLTHVYVQPTAVKTSMEYMQTGQDQLRSELIGLTEQTPPGLRFVVLPSHDPLMTGIGDDGEAGGKFDAPERCNKRVGLEWLDRVEGGAGCWSEAYAF